MKSWDPVKIRERINEVLPEGRVIPRHTEDGHFYEINDGKFEVNPVYPSATGKLQILKDESIINYKMNRALEYVFANYKHFDDNNVMDHLDKAAKVSADNLADAGDIGTRIHDYRELVFKEWIKTGNRPEDFVSFIPKEEYDIRAVSGMRALQKFCQEKDYIPVACELLVYNHEHKVAGTLDDLGLMKNGNKWELVLLDLKTSNQFKNHYFFQVALYWWMFWRLMGKEWKPQRCFILKVSKEDGSYKIEDLKRPAKLSEYTRAMLKTNEGIDFIKKLRKDNQKLVGKI